MESVLKYSLLAIAFVALCTGINVLIGGASAIPGATGGAEAAIDNELRFFSVFWLAFGGFCFWVARNPQTQHHYIPWILLVFFISGIGRLCSVILTGLPGNILFMAMIIEFVLPIALYYLYHKQRKKLAF